MTPMFPLAQFLFPLLLLPLPLPLWLYPQALLLHILMPNHLSQLLVAQSGGYVVYVVLPDITRGCVLM